MTMRFLYLFTASFAFFLIFLLPPKTFAAGDFLVNYSVNYSVSSAGETNVIQDISLINNKTNLYAREYSIIIDSTRIKNISASDSKGSITPSVSERDTKTEIRLVFNEEVVGQGKVLRFQLKYQDENIAKKNGTVWEVNIPGIAQDEDLGDYTVTLHTPDSFGPAAYMVPEPTVLYKWSKEALINGGVSAAFGTQQVFDVNLSYYLENTQATPILTEIALPPSSNFQFTSIQSLQPQPETITIDADGNWLARYKLDSQSNMIVQAKLIVQLFLHPRTSKTDPKPNDSYLATTQYWNVNDPTVAAIAESLKTPQNIYDYVVKTLSYDYERINQQEDRKGALQALKNPKNAVCTEFTDLFVTLARAAGIPARQAVGYAYTTNAKLRPLSLVSDVLHAWPEYYDPEKKMWIPVDPTWGNTTGGIDYFNKLDFNHIVFAYNGEQDDYPYPAGFYRQAGRVGKDVDVLFHEGQLGSQSVALTTGFKFPSTILAGFKASGQALIRNNGNIAAENTRIQIDSSDFNIAHEIVSPMIPPFGVVSVPIEVQTSSLFASGKKLITTSVNGVSQSHAIAITPAFYLFIPTIIIVIWIIILIGVVRAWRNKR